MGASASSTSSNWTTSHGTPSVIAAINRGDQVVSSATSSFPAVAGPSSAAAMAALYNTDNSARAVNVCLPSKIDAFPSGAVAIFSCLPKIIGRFKMLTPNRPLLKSFFSSAVRFGSTSRHPLAFPKETSSIFTRTLSWTTLGAITFITFGFFPFAAAAAMAKQSLLARPRHRTEAASDQTLQVFTCGGALSLLIAKQGGHGESEVPPSAEQAIPTAEAHKKKHTRGRRDHVPGPQKQQCRPVPHFGNALATSPLPLGPGPLIPVPVMARNPYLQKGQIILPPRKHRHLGRSKKSLSINPAVV